MFSPKILVDRLGQFCFEWAQAPLDDYLFSPNKKTRTFGKDPGAYD